MSDAYRFGHPREKCSKCEGLNRGRVGLKLPEMEEEIKPYYRPGQGGKKVFLIGQDPTIARKPGRVNVALMLDDDKSQLSRWLKGVFGSKYDGIEIYATNLVKCFFSSPPAGPAAGGLAGSL